MSQESREIPKISCLLPSKETEMSISYVSVTPAKKIRTNKSQDRRATTQASSLLPSKETQLRLFDVTKSPAKKRERTSISQAIQDETEKSISDATLSPGNKRERTSISQALHEYRFMDSEETIPPAKNILTDMSKEPRVQSKNTEEFRLFGVSILLSSAFSTSKDEELKKSNCLISTTLCLYDETWPCGNPDYPNVTYAPRNEENLKKIDCMKDLENGLISTTLCLYDETWPSGNPNYANFTCAPRNEEVTEQTRKIEEVKEDVALYRDSTDPWIIKKDMNKTESSCGQLSLSSSDVEQHILRYLSEDDQKKLGQGFGITVNVHDHETDTSHKLFLMRWISKEKYFLKGSWLHDFFRRRGLRGGDKIGLFWDRFRNKLQFCVLSRATAKAPAEEKKLLNQ